MPNKETFGSRLKHAWNAFLNRDPPNKLDYADIGPSFSTRPDRPTLRFSNERTILAAIISRISIDVSRTTIQHVKLDENGRFDHVIKSGMNNCLTVEANIDQNAQQFKHDITFSMLDEGYVAVVPIDAKFDIRETDSFDIQTMRVARIVEWYPQHVRVEAYDEKTGLKELLQYPKSKVAIIENPFYAVMNEPNSTLKRLVRKMALLDSVDERTCSGKLDLLVQLPYAIKGELRIAQAEMRREAIKNQLTDGYGIGYIDSTEHVTQLNRPVENSLPDQIQQLTDRLYNQLGLTQAILDGSASDAEWTNYYNQTIEPIVAAIAGEFNRKFLTKTARSQGQTIYYFKDPFRFIPVTNLANIADVMTRNAIMSSNEFRQILGMKASPEPDADALRNKNMPIGMEPGAETMAATPMDPAIDPSADSQITGDTPVSMIGDFRNEMAQSEEANEDKSEIVLVHFAFSDKEQRLTHKDETELPSRQRLPKGVPRDTGQCTFVIQRNFKNAPGTGG